MAEVAAWACPACTYLHEGAEAGFLQCAMCGGSKATTETAPAPAPRPSPPKKRQSPSPKKPAKRRRSSVSPQKGPTIADYFRRPPKGPPDEASAAAMAAAPAEKPRSEPVVVDLRGSSDDEAAPPPQPRRHRLSLGAAVELVGLSNAEFNGRRGVVAAPPADLAAGRIAVTVDGRTLALKRENVVAARSASPPRAAPASSAAPPAPAPVPPPPPQAPTVEPASVDDALPDFDPARGLDAVLSTDGRPAYAIVARALDAVSATRSRLAKENALTNALRWGLTAPSINAQDLAALCYLLAPTRDSQGGGHRLEPDWQHVALGLPSKAIAAGCAAGSGASPEALKAAARRTGGLADAVVALRAGPPSFFKAKAPNQVIARSRAAADVRASLRALGRARSDRAKVDGIAALVRTCVEITFQAPHAIDATSSP